MADYDPSSIPILDDIISRGDTEKAANRPENDLLKSLEAEHDQAPDIETQSADAAPEPGLEPEIEQSAQDTHVDQENLYASEPAHVPDESPFDSNTEQASGEISEQLPVAIDTLTEEILASVMPEMERLLRERIRETLEQQQQNGDSQATNTSYSS